jgi:DNA-binding phage protein
MYFESLISIRPIAHMLGQVRRIVGLAQYAANTQRIQQSVCESYSHEQYPQMYSLFR